MDRQLPYVERRPSMADDVCDALRALIMDGVIPAGGRVNLDETARRLRVSPSPVREALARLEAEGLVVKEPYRGYSTTSLFSRDELVDLFDFRFVLEPWAAARAADRIDDDGRNRLRDELDTCPTAPSETDYAHYRVLTAHDERLHDLVLELAGNDHARRSFARTHCHLHILRLHYRTRMGTAALQEHRALVEAIVSGDANAAGAAMRAHLDASLARLLATFSD